MQLYPDEPVYHCDLGWAYFKKNPPEVEPALEHLREALRLDPNNADARSRLEIVQEQG